MAACALYERRIQDYVWLEISDEVIGWKANLYSNDNAVANRSIINSDPNTALDSDSYQAEVLIWTVLGFPRPPFGCPPVAHHIGGTHQLIS